MSEAAKIIENYVKENQRLRALLARAAEAIYKKNGQLAVLAVELEAASK